MELKRSVKTAGKTWNIMGCFMENNRNFTREREKFNKKNHTFDILNSNKPQDILPKQYTPNLEYFMSICIELHMICLWW